MTLRESEGEKNASETNGMVEVTVVQPFRPPPCLSPSWPVEAFLSLGLLYLLGSPPGRQTRKLTGSGQAAAEGGKEGKRWERGE